MRRYRVLFADDTQKQFEIFRDVTVENLSKRNIIFEPLDYARTVFPVKDAPCQSVEEHLQDADSQGVPYDLLVTDLNFTTGGLGGGPKDGFAALKLAKSKWPSIKLILITAHGRSILPQDAIHVAEATGLSSAHWIDLTGGGLQVWQNLATVCELLCDLIDRERSGHPQTSAPDLYEIVVKEHISETSEDGSRREHLRLYIREKKPGAKQSHVVDIFGDHAVILQEIAFAEGTPVPGRVLLNSLNRSSRGGSEYITYGIGDLSQFFSKYQIQLKGEERRNLDRTMCRSDNDVLCGWQRGGSDPTPDAEGYSCFAATGGSANGHCPKRLLKRRHNRASDSSLQEGADRRKVQEMRTRYLRPLETIFGAGFSGERGLIRTIHGRGGGYALAGTIKFEDDG